jgi:hypothetical protein
MKKLVIILLCTAVTMSVSAQRWKTVEANGPIVKKERSIEGFSSIDVSAGIDVYLTQGKSSILTVETEKNLHEYIQTEVRGDVLHVFSKKKIKDSKSKKVYVTMDVIKSLSASSAGDIIGESVINAGNIELEASSAGDIRLELNAKSVMVDCSSAGDINLEGKAGYLKASVSSAGDLNAGDFKVKEAKVSASSSGNIRVNVSDKLYARASSTGDVRYTGDPEVDAKSSSAGSVKRK